MAEAIIVGAWFLLCVFLVFMTVSEWHESRLDERNIDWLRYTDKELRFMAGVSRRMKFYDVLTVASWLAAGLASFDLPGLLWFRELLGISAVAIFLLAAAVFFLLRVIASRHLRKLMMRRL